MNMLIDAVKRDDLFCAVTSEPEAHGFLEKCGFSDYMDVEMDLRLWADDEYCGFGVYRLSGMTLRNSPHLRFLE